MAKQPQTPTGKVYVYSTLTNATKYVDYEPGGADLPNEKRSVLIHGGTGIADKRLVTPHGVVTEISAEDLAWLEKNYHFQQHVERGHIVIDKKKFDPEKVAGDMNTKDESAPLTPSDYEKGDIKEPMVGKVK